MSVISTYAKEVKKKLIDKGMSQVELMDEIKNRTGLYVDSSYISRIFNGKSNAPKIVAAINEILEIEE